MRTWPSSRSAAAAAYWRRTNRRQTVLDGLDRVSRGFCGEMGSGPPKASRPRQGAMHTGSAACRSQSLRERTPMPDTTCHMSISLDGFVAGPDQSRDDPLGKRGREVHGWHLGDPRATEADATAEGWLMRPRGAYIMGPNMFGPVRSEWD